MQPSSSSPGDTEARGCPLPPPPHSYKARRWAGAVRADLRRAFASRLFVFSMIVMHGCLLLHYLVEQNKGTAFAESFGNIHPELFLLNLVLSATYMLSGSIGFMMYPSLPATPLWVAPIPVLLLAVPITALGLMRAVRCTGDAELLGITRTGPWAIALDAWRVMLLRVGAATFSLLPWPALLESPPIPGAGTTVAAIAGLAAAAVWSSTIMSALGSLPQLPRTGGAGMLTRGLLALLLLVLIFLWFRMLALPRAAQMGYHVMPWDLLFPRFGVLHAEGIVPIPGLYISWAAVLAMVLCIPLALGMAAYALGPQTYRRRDIPRLFALLLAVPWIWFVLSGGSWRYLLQMQLLIGAPVFLAMLLEPPRPELAPWPGSDNEWSLHRAWHMLMVSPNGPCWVAGCVVVWSLTLAAAILSTFAAGRLVVRIESIYALPLCFLGALSFPVLVYEALNLVLRGFRMDSNRRVDWLAMSPAAGGVLAGFIYMCSYIVAHVIGVYELWAEPVLILCPPVLAITMVRASEFVNYSIFAACVWPFPLLLGWHAARAEFTRAELDGCARPLNGVLRAGMGSAFAGTLPAALLALLVIRSGSEFPIEYNYGLVETIAFSPDGSRMAGSHMEGDEYGVRVWNLNTQRRQFPSIILSSSLRHAEFSPDGTRLLTTTFSDAIPRMWDAATGKALPLHPGIVPADPDTSCGYAAFAMEGKALVLSTGDTLRIWSLADGKLLGDNINAESVTRIVAAPQGSRFVVTSSSRSPRIWDAAAGTPVGRPLSETPLTAAHFSPDGNTLAGIIKEPEGKARAFLWDAATGEQMLPLEGSDFEPETLSFSPDGKVIRAADMSGVVLSFDIAAKSVTKLEPAPGKINTRTCFSADGSRMVQALSRSGKITVRDPATGRLLYTPLQGYRDVHRHVFLTPDGSRVLLLTRVLRIWDLRLVARL